jgi:DNA-binding response OmpR family regulator
MRLLIVEDDPLSRKVLTAQLSDAGHVVIEAVNGIEALGLMDHSPVDAVISDILMPRMDGFRLCREIRQRRSADRDVPFIMYTATYDSPSDRQLAGAVGADSYILKPSPVAHLLSAVSAAQRRKPRTGGDCAPLAEDVLAQYSATLVRKLEQRNQELQRTVLDLQSAQAQVAQLNRELEERVQQRTAELVTANAELHEFSYFVSHDLRAPLHVAKNLMDMLVHDCGTSLDPEARRLVESVREGHHRMDTIIGGLLALARAAGGAFERTPIQMTELAQTVVCELASAHKGIPAEVTVSPLPSALGDASLIRQVWINLIGNAVKYSSKESHPRITISGREENLEAIYSVQDNGVGFDIRRSDRLFRASSGYMRSTSTAVAGWV